MVLSQESKIMSSVSLVKNSFDVYSSMVSLITESVLSRKLGSERNKLLNLQKPLTRFLYVWPSSIQAVPWSDKLSAGSIPVPIVTSDTLGDTRK